MGQAPSRDTDGKPPLTGRSGRRLAALCGLSHKSFLARFEAVNLLWRWPGKAGKGDAFDARTARSAAKRLAGGKLRGKRLVLLGGNVARSFGVKVEPLVWTEQNGLTFATVPHPSGVNRWWNDVVNERKAKKFLRSLL